MKKAFDLLKERGLEYQFHDYKKAGITEDKIKQWFKLQPWEKFINKQGTTYKKLSEQEKIAVTTPERAIKLMIEKNSIIKRPILESNGRLYLGFDNSWENLS